MLKIIYALFKAVLYSSAYGSFVAIMILMVKRLFKNKLSASWHYYIWILLIIRLSIPYSYQSSLSIFNIFTRQVSNVEMSYNSPKFQNKSETQSNMPSSALPPIKIEQITNRITEVKSTIKNANLENINLLNIASIIWLTVTISALVFIFIINKICNIKIRNQHICTDKETLELLGSCRKMTNIKRDVPIVYADNINGVSLYGIFRPQILISEKVINNFDKEQKRYIFLHELTHLKYKDILINWIMLVLAVCNWFNPIILYSFYRMKQDCEFSCDEKVMSYIQPISCKIYGYTIINMTALFSKSYNLFNSMALASNKINLKRRICMINSFKKRSLQCSIVGFTVIALIGIVCLVNPKATASAYKKTPIKDSINVNNTNSMTEGQQVTTNVPDMSTLEIVNKTASKDNDGKSNFSIKEEKPTVDLGDLKEVNTENYSIDSSSNDKDAFRIATYYKSPSGKELVIIQGGAEKTQDGTLFNIANKTRTTKVKGVDATICEVNGGRTQVIFVKNGKFYNVMGYKMSLEELTKIAESLK